LESVKFEWIQHEKLLNDENIRFKNAYEGQSIGFIAQKLEQILPTVVWTDEEGYKTVQYDILVTIGIGAVQEQQRRLESINSRIKYLKEKISG